MFERGKISWIFFDVGDTLVDEAAPYESIIDQFVHYANERGYSIDKASVYAGIQEGFEALHPSPMKLFMETQITSDEDLVYIRKSMKYEKHLERPFAEAVAVLAKLAERYQIGIIANQSAGTAARLEQYGLLPHISVVCSSAEVGVSKPDLKFFQMALDEAGCSPEQAIMVGDRIDNDILPAHALGMGTIWVRQGLARKQPVPWAGVSPDVIVEHLAEIGPILLD
ncbi:HAD family hydrolase [Paenibacillus sp. SYP-B3998]|uniref:HAD family hydrolase n=1 Tax=Paenibacillus sp. SYP-B3998 TaxID=2678564 RepID=A0A6G3ZWD1_9BACL|nr:HAD family hydrolase [Paenibacillus sp. SYP-B3998]NEW06526.1 HAD family hydrolase [Paenibacillus sp. SYP-B3998]